MTVASLAAYSLSRLRYRGRRALSSAVFFVYLFPSTLLSAPLLVLYFVAQRYIVAGLSAGAVKG